MTLYNLGNVLRDDLRVPHVIGENEYDGPLLVTTGAGVSQHLLGSVSALAQLLAKAL